MAHAPTLSTKGLEIRGPMTPAAEEILLQHQRQAVVDRQVIFLHPVSFGRWRAHAHVAQILEFSPGDAGQTDDPQASLARDLRCRADVGRIPRSAEPDKNVPTPTQGPGELGIGQLGSDVIAERGARRRK